MSNFFGDDFVVPSFTFADLELDVGQRWSTWPAITPSERGPRPWPDWVVTSAAAVDTELGILKTGKEADVFLLERGVPDDPAGAVLLAAKRYRSSEHRDFHRSGVYREGRVERRSRDQRAIERGTAYGRSVAAVAWSYAEFEALARMHSRGIAVPYPVQVNGTELLIEFIGTGIDCRAAARAVERGGRPSWPRCSSRWPRSCSDSPGPAAPTATCRPTTCSCTTGGSW